jgi:hypothetical protein
VKNPPDQNREHSSLPFAKLLSTAMKLKSFENCFNEFFFLNQDQLVEEVDDLGLKDKWFFHHWQKILEQDAANKKFLVL